MAQYDFKERIEESYVESTDVMTGDKNRSRYLFYQLKSSMDRAKQIDIIVSFLMESGVRMLLKDLKAALERGVPIRILTGNYLGITQPSALFLIKKELGDGVDLRFYNEKERSFHPKSYIFHYENMSEIYIGSSNVSRSALTSGIEWNYRFSSEQDNKNFNLFYDTFLDLFENHSYVIDNEELTRYSKSWHKPAVAKDIARYDQLDLDTKVEVLFQPRGAQIEALCALENSRAEGAMRGLVHAATGIGKTYLAAFDSAKYESVLFVAHREEILKIDEFHHAVNEQYRRIVEYFKPQFMLGLTATPERMDGKSIYEICDYNVPYEITLKEAINKGALVPFHYYGVYDETDYSALHLVKGRYAEKDLDDKYIGNTKRYDLIYKYYKKYRSKRALGFCSSRKHAEEMAKEFCKRGVKAVAVYSNANGEFSEERDLAIQKLKNQEIQVIFSVDMFNEGVDIAALDMVMFLRPTESPTVFLQQLGRGLRTSRGKEYLNVLDFIGNYEKAGRAPFLLSGGTNFGENKTRDYYEIEYPDDCIVDFDMRLIDLFHELDKKSLSIKDRIKQEYYRVKEFLDGKVPTRMELFTHMDEAVYEYCMKHSKENPFKRYMEFLYELQELSEEEMQLYSGMGREFLQLIETTDMQKVYKMPILSGFYNEGNVRLAVTDEEVLECWKKFFDHGTNWKDFPNVTSYEEYQKITDKQHLSKAKSMPIKFLKASGKGFFVEKEGYALAIRSELADVIRTDAFKKQMKDIIEYRTMEYYRRRYVGR